MICPIELEYHCHFFTPQALRFEQTFDCFSLKNSVEYEALSAGVLCRGASLMGKSKKHRSPSPEWKNLEAQCLWPEQIAYEIIRPCQLEKQSLKQRAVEVGLHPRTIARKLERFQQLGLPGLVPDSPDDTVDHRRLPLEVREEILRLKAEYPAFIAHEIAVICAIRFQRASDTRVVQHVLNTYPSPTQPARRFPRASEEEDSEQRRHTIIQLHFEGWTVKSIAGYLGISTKTVQRTLRRWVEEGTRGLADKSHAPITTQKMTLPIMAKVKQLQENPELGEFRIHAALKAMGIEVSPRTCGRILALNRKLYGLRKTVPRSKKAMPFAAHRRHQYWSVDVRYIERHQCRDHQGYIYTVTIWDNYSRQILASGLFRTQDLTAYLTILYQALAHFGIPEAIVSDSGGIFLAKLARQIYQKLGIRKVEIDKGQSWENYAETLFNINRRLADHWYHQATSWEEITDIHVDFVRTYNEQEHFAHRKRADGRRTPQDVLGWVKGREIDPAKLDDAFTLRRVRLLDQRGYVRFQNWRIYAEAGLARRPADLWIYNETLSIQFTTTLLAQYAVHYHMASHQLLEVGTYQAFPSVYQSPQLSLWQGEDIVWRPAYKLDAPPRRSSRRGLAMIQYRLFSEEAE